MYAGADWLEFICQSGGDEGPLNCLHCLSLLSFLLRASLSSVLKDFLVLPAAIVMHGLQSSIGNSHPQVIVIHGSFH